MLKTKLTNCNECLGTGRAKRYLPFAGFEYLYFVNCKLCNEQDCPRCGMKNIPYEFKVVTRKFRGCYNCWYRGETQ